MRIAEIKYNDIANGTGIRTTVFVSGCTHHCYNCFNQIAWDFKYGKEYTKEIEDQIIESLKFPHIEGLTMLGGEPMEFVNQKDTLNLIKRVRKELPNKTIWCFTGYLFEDLLPNGKMSSPYTDELLANIDVLVDGEYVDALRDISLLFKGSSNQRTIDVPKSLAEHKVVEKPLMKGTI